jgi:hypothetical protein
MHSGTIASNDLLDNDPMQWNALLSPWLEAIDTCGNLIRISPLDAIRRSLSIHSLAFSNPLDLFSAHRFLQTLLYWKADAFGGVNSLRCQLLSGEIPSQLVDTLAAEADCFLLFDSKKPFLQDPSCANDEKLPKSPPSYFFAEMSSGTNIAHFHHGDDKTSALCLCCATRGLMRLVPWTQSGGSGLQPSIHGPPPIMALALGITLCHTLGLNLVPINFPTGNPQWTGQFKPERRESVVPFLEAFTWNPRRVNLLRPFNASRCSLCGLENINAVGPVIFMKNDACMDKSEEGQQYKNSWRDPSAFYRLKDEKTIKASDESEVVNSTDLRKLFAQKRGKKEDPAPVCQIVANNLDHESWALIVPCTNPANNKSFDHRLITIAGKFDEASILPRREGMDIPLRAGDLRTKRKMSPVQASRGAKVFVAAARRLTEADWAVVAESIGKPLGHDAGAFDIFSSLYWAVRTKHTSAPSRECAWMTLKLMAKAGKWRMAVKSDFQPWAELEVCQPEQTNRSGLKLAYPRKIPSGPLLERELGEIISHSSRKSVDWAGLCQFLQHQLS